MTTETERLKKAKLNAAMVEEARAIWGDQAAEQLKAKLASEDAA